MVVSDILKTRIHTGLSPDLFYWREKSGYEIDLIIEQQNQPVPIEIKSGKTLNSDFFKTLTHFRSVTGTNKSILLYSGNDSLTRSDGTVISNWKMHDRMLNQ
jgi:predicted AAA+ superfamily ATPase